MRRVGYGNATHLNMSVIVGGDNKAIIQVALDRQDKDYFACDAGKFWHFRTPHARLSKDFHTCARTFAH